MSAILVSPALGDAKVLPALSSSSASHVAAEVLKGRLNPADSRPGDEIVLKLKDDIKSNGSVVVKKGTTITGVVRSVMLVSSDAAPTGEAKAPFQSILAIEWLVPPVQGRAAQTVSIALHSVTELRTVTAREVESAGEEFGMPSAVVTESLSTPRASGQSNPALLNMPSVVAADVETASAIDRRLKTSAAGRLFKVGNARITTPTGAHEWVNMFSHLNNDTVIVAENNFEISAGAQMQLLVGVHKK